MENLNLEALTEQELVDINAGGFWYDVAYGVGWLARSYADQVGMWSGSAAHVFN